MEGAEMLQHAGKRGSQGRLCQVQDASISKEGKKGILLKDTKADNIACSVTGEKEERGVYLHSEAGGN